MMGGMVQPYAGDAEWQMKLGWLACGSSFAVWPGSGGWGPLGYIIHAVVNNQLPNLSGLNN